MSEVVKTAFGERIIEIRKEEFHLYGVIKHVYVMVI